MEEWTDEWEMIRQWMDEWRMVRLKTWNGLSNISYQVYHITCHRHDGKVVRQDWGMGSGSGMESDRDRTPEASLPVVNISVTRNGQQQAWDMLSKRRRPQSPRS